MANSNPARVPEMGCGSSTASDWAQLSRLYRLSLGRKATVNLLDALVNGQFEQLAQCLQRSVSDVSRGRMPEVDVAAVMPDLSDDHRLTLVTKMFEHIEPGVSQTYAEASSEPFKTQGRAPLSPDRLQSLISSIREIAKREPFAFQRDILTTGSFSVTSPFTGQAIAASASLLVVTENAKRTRPFPIYSFDDEERFFIYANPLFGGLSGIFFPERNLLLSNDRDGDAFVVPRLKALMVTYAAKTIEGLKPADPRRIALAYGVLDQIGHTILNELEALHQVVKAGLADGVSVVVKGTNSFVEIGELFPELEDRPVVQSASMADGYLKVLADRLMVVRPTCGEYWFSCGLSERFNRVGQAVHREKGAAEDVSQAALDGAWPIIWVELKSNRRHWVGQVEGVPAIVNALKADYPDLGVVLAGWSRFSDGVPRSEDEKMISLDRALAAQIAERIDADVPVVDISGCTTREKIGWCLLANSYVAVQSSGLVFPVGMARKSGVIHASSLFTDFARTLRADGLDYIEDCPIIHYIDFSKVTDLDEGKKWWARNYDVNWTEIYRPLKSMLDSLSIEPTSRPQ
jgi:hypothetical protein